jgi:hypothetical protein
MFLRWRASLRDMTASTEGAREWRERRYRFAYRLGQELAGAPAGRQALRGRAVYGVWLPWGLLYIGQTARAERRLRDLPVGESHHLANTFPPEIWARVVVLCWEGLDEARRPVDALGAETVGLALEYRLHALTKPLANLARRTHDGAWRAVRVEASRSVGARAGAEVDPLFARVWALWQQASVADATTYLPAGVRCVFPDAIDVAD